VVGEVVILYWSPVRGATYVATMTDMTGRRQSRPTRMGAPDVAAEFRLAMRRVAAPVSVVTTAVEGRPLGTTVSAFDSLSMSPPMMTVALRDSSSLLAVVRPGTSLGVNVLRSDQAEVALAFAASVADRFAEVDWYLDVGVPRLRDLHAWIALSVHELVHGGDHVVLVCDVRGAARGDGAPLVYHDRVFGTHLVCPVRAAGDRLAG
jgi:flavin reductase (DIM6/NTAB) family NADH-FMN oxidoreductase RutF